MGTMLEEAPAGWEEEGFGEWNESKELGLRSETIVFSVAGKVRRRSPSAVIDAPSRLTIGLPRDK
jgi:hypothetical protein